MSKTIVRELACDFKGCPLEKDAHLSFLLVYPWLMMACLERHEDPQLRHWATVFTRIIDHYADDFDVIKRLPSGLILSAIFLPYLTSFYLLTHPCPEPFLPKAVAFSN